MLVSETRDKRKFNFSKLLINARYFDFLISTNRYLFILFLIIFSLIFLFLFFFFFSFLIFIFILFFVRRNEDFIKDTISKRRRNIERLRDRIGRRRRSDEINSRVKIRSLRISDKRLKR